RKETTQAVEARENTVARLRPRRIKATKGLAKIEAKFVSRRKNQAVFESEDESTEDVPQSVSLTSSRPSRRAKTAALERTKMNLSKLLDKE
ncbi:hypothetical protein JRQ81_017026, partial [Phrynocephalus forsythii]